MDSTNSLHLMSNSSFARWELKFPFADEETEGRRAMCPKVRKVPRSTKFPPGSHRPQSQRSGAFLSAVQPESPELVQAVKHAFSRTERLNNHT